MEAPSLEYARRVVRYLAEADKVDESVLQDDTGVQVAYRVRAGQFIGLWTVATHELRIFGTDGAHVAGALPEDQRAVETHSRDN